MVDLIEASPTDSQRGLINIMNVKGTAWIVMMKYFNECHTAEQREKLKAALDEKTRELFENKTVLPFSWIDYGTHMKVMLTADKVIGRGDIEISLCLCSQQV
jgi:hypothetical protein